MPRSEASSDTLRRPFESTYLSLRIGVAAIGVALSVCRGFNGADPRHRPRAGVAADAAWLH